MEDIEDIIAASDDVRSEVAPPAPMLGTAAVRGVHSEDNGVACAAPKASDESTTGVPGTERIWVKTYGCSHNISDSEYMAGALDSYGYELVQKKEDADLWLINSCTVKDPSESAFLNLVRAGQVLGKHIVVAGCVTQADEKGLGKGLEGVSVVGISQIDRVVEVVEETLKGHETRLLEKKDLPSLDLPKIRKDPLVEIVPLSTGCLGACTYCKTRHARGVLGSYQKSAIVKRAETAISEGVKEIWLSSEDTGAYGRDIGESMPGLLKALIAAVEAAPNSEHVMLRVGMTNPPFILDHLDEIAEVLRHPRVFSFLHVPVQSGCNSVLEMMNREYTVEEFRRVCDFLTARVPGLNLATDIICGFPSESEEDFDKTMELCEHYKFPFLNISQFYPRPGTKAADMKRVKTQIVKARSRKLTALFKTYMPFEHMVGARYVRVWVATEVSKSGHSVAHTKGYVKVLLPRNDELRGTSLYVKIVSAAKFHVVGEPENPVAVEAFQALNPDPQSAVHGTLFASKAHSEASSTDAASAKVAKRSPTHSEAETDKLWERLWFRLVIATLISIGLLVWFVYRDDTHDSISYEQQDL